MAKYECKNCGMTVGSMTCGKCLQELTHETEVKEDGSVTQVCRCPNGDGHVKSPICCGDDMKRGKPNL